MEMRVSYDAMPDEYPAHAQPTGGDPISSADGFRKRLIYRSKQRGWCVYATGHNTMAR